MTLISALVLLLLALPVLAWAINRLAPRQAAGWLLRLQRHLAGLSDRKIKLGTLRIVYSEGGQGEPLLLLHGLGADRTTFERVAGALTGSYHLYIPDLPGFGASGRPEDGDYGIDAQVERVDRLVVALGLDKFDLGGNSMGGWIAAAYAARFPGKVRSLWLLAAAGTGEMLQTQAVIARQQRGAYILLARDRTEFKAVLRLIFTRTPSLPYCILQVASQRSAAYFPLHAKIFDQLLEDGEKHRLEPHLPQVTAPTLLVWGEDDRVVPLAVMQCFQRLLPHASAVLMKGVGHVPQLEAPRQVAADYRRFRAGIDRGEGPRHSGETDEYLKG